MRQTRLIPIDEGNAVLTGDDVDTPEVAVLQGGRNGILCQLVTHGFELRRTGAKLRDLCRRQPLRLPRQQRCRIGEQRIDLLCQLCERPIRAPQGEQLACALYPVDLETRISVRGAFPTREIGHLHER